jgi:hypothetical protein
MRLNKYERRNVMNKDLAVQDGAQGFIRTFGGNPNAYAVQHYENGKQYYEAIREPITESIIESHLNGEITVAVYPLNFDMVNFSTVDIDIDDIGNESMWAAARQYIKSICVYARMLGISLLIEDTGNRGYHLYAFFEDHLQARHARHLMRILTSEITANWLDGVEVEIFPKQNITYDLGNPVKLPLGIHQKTQRCSTIINQEFEPVEEPLRTIINCTRVDSATLELILDLYPEPDPCTRYDSDWTEISGYDEEGDPGLAVEQCAFLNAQLDHPQQPYDEWVATISIVLPFGDAGTAWGHKLSESYLYYTPEETDDKIASLRADGMSPWSCATIRERFGKCPDDCVLESLGDSQPSPVRLCYPVAGGIKAGCALSPEPSCLHEAVNLDIADLLPSNGFLKDYLDYASPLTEAPEVFHVFVGLIIMSIVVNRQIYIQFGDRMILPNLWVVLIAPTSLYRKSTAIAMGTDLLRVYKPELMMPNEFTPEALVESLKDSPIGLLVHYEFKSLLEMVNRPYMMGAKPLLAELYDCPSVFTRKLKNKPTIVLKNPFLSLIAATTLVWLNKNIGEDDLESGFLARCMYVPVSTKEKDLIIPPPADKALKQKLIDQLKKLSSISGEVDISLIRAQHDDYALHLRGSISDDDVTMAGFIARLEINILKIAALVEASCSGQLVVSPESYLIASRIIEYLADCLKKHVMRDLMATKDERDIEKIKAYIGNNPGCSRKKILQDCNLTADKAWKLVTLLEESGEIVVVIKGKGKYHYLAGYEDIPEAS